MDLASSPSKDVLLSPGGEIFLAWRFWKRKSLCAYFPPTVLCFPLVAETWKCWSKIFFLLLKRLKQDHWATGSKRASSSRDDDFCLWASPVVLSLAWLGNDFMTSKHKRRTSGATQWIHSPILLASGERVNT